MVAITNNRTREYTIPFLPGQLESLGNGSVVIYGGTIELARKRQHRHENPSYMKRRFM